MAKRRNLKNIEIEEVSLVDLPANKLSFLFFKRKGVKESQIVKAKKKIKIEIESDGTIGGTSISVNGSKLGKLRNFDFSFYGTDAKQSINASYSKTTETDDGFSRTETYYLSKGDIMKSETLKALQAYLGTEDIDFEKKVSEEGIAKALTLITEHYKESFPEDLEKAVGVIAKCAASGCEVGDNKDGLEKAGAKFSKDVLKKLKAVLAAVEALKSILPDMKDPTEKSSSSDDVVNDFTKRITQLSEAVAKMGKAKETKKNDDDPSVADLTKTLEDVSKRIKDMEESGVTRKSLSDDGSDDKDDPKGAGEKGEQLWPSITGNESQ